jgi:fatty acid desaturase
MCARWAPHSSDRVARSIVHAHLTELRELQHPLQVCNAWLVLYTWMQHTAEDVPHFGEDQWTWEKGAFMTIDRPYGPVFDFLHHRIGSTHVAHHLNHQVRPPPLSELPRPRSLFTSP